MPILSILASVLLFLTKTIRNCLNLTEAEKTEMLPLQLTEIEMK